MSLITLQTDFGTTDAFVGIMKGVILGIDPDLRIVDLSHHIPPYDLKLPGLNWIAAVPYFPSGTVHVAVVDPGVGTGRDLIVAVIRDQLFLCPDNGLLTPVVKAYGAPKELFTVSNKDWRVKLPHPTFHGRDIIAPVAAHLAIGDPLTLVGPRRTTPLVTLPWPEAKTSAGRIEAEVLYVDHFGNAWLNIREAELQTAAIPAAEACITLAGRRCVGMVQSYGFVPKGEMALLVNSVGQLEVGINQGSAAAEMGLTQGTPVIIERSSS